MVALSCHRARNSGNKRAYTLLESGEEERQSYTYAELDERARAIASQILSRTEPGSRVLVLCPPGVEYVAAYFGCLYARVVAVPAYPPTATRQIPHLTAIANDCAASLALTGSSAGRMARALQQSEGLGGLGWLDTNEATSPANALPLPDPNSVAMLQYTSGSTGDPKGVVVTHRNLVANSAVISDWLEHPAGTPGVTWLPPYHDMGLIGGVLQPLYAEFEAIMLTPLAFVQRPIRWLRAISRYQATVSGGPNFAYELCVRSTTHAERAQLDLSSWSTAFCGAEPINPDTVSRFIDAFAVSGFRSKAFCPAYGLAEATLAVTGKAPLTDVTTTAFSSEALDRGQARATTSDQPGSRRIVSCGRALPGVSLAIVDPETRERVEPGSLGEIWIKSDGVAQGYWRRPEQSRATFEATATDGESVWLRSGDMAFMHEEQLYVTSRLKDLIIIRGKKFSPTDIERAAELNEARLRPGSTIAFSVPGLDSEELVIVGSTTVRDPTARTEVAAAIRRAIAVEFQLAVKDICLVSGAGIPVTSSGKLRRSACRDSYRLGSSKDKA